MKQNKNKYKFSQFILSAARTIILATNILIIVISLVFFALFSLFLCGMLSIGIHIFIFSSIEFINSIEITQINLEQIKEIIDFIFIASIISIFAFGIYKRLPVISSKNNKKIKDKEFNEKQQRERFLKEALEKIGSYDSTSNSRMNDIFDIVKKEKRTFTFFSLNNNEYEVIPFEVFYNKRGDIEIKPKLSKQFTRKDGSQNYKAYFLQSKNNVDVEGYYKYLDDEAIQCKEVICSIARFAEYGMHRETTEKEVRNYVIEYISKFEYNIDFYKYLIDLHPYYINGLHSNLLADEKFIYEIEEHIIHSNDLHYNAKKFYLELLERLVNKNNNKGEQL